ncbi:RnfABCDGE type electron transport complex subunit D [Acidimangrovimonas sediminis]|uniref:RnfABCDGE type electron transport complex subunit D n=1 Tax=Acidimangrovimonas sediminis TaxID=2056283 RepID=UPI000C8047A8|nr:RnfABCDGE type electron transport complex subunit D [Acidimangrovimonas sediminis]
MTRAIDHFLNRTTMYRLVLYYLLALAGAALVGGFWHLSPVDPAQLALSALIVWASCMAVNAGFARLLRVPVNAESVHITALILVLLMPPVAAANHMGIAGLIVASAAAIGSKFLIAVRRKHIFNPVAAGAVAAYLFGQPATWWVDGSPLLLAVVLAGGFLVVRKVQRFDMVAVYLLANLAVTLSTAALSMPLSMLGQTLQFSVLYSPLFFAGFAMLTEPLTAPHARGARLIYGAIVGALSSPGVHVGGFYPTPEMAFLAGNLVAFLMSPKGRFLLRLERVERTAEAAYDYVFTPDRPLRFRPGQYLDWTLEVPNPDNRGNRRTFTIASAPTESEVRLGVKFYPGPSSYKQALARMRPGDVIHGTQIAGGFTLPERGGEKIALIAGGIGVTPFRSMVRHLMDTGDRRSVVLLYGNTRASEIAYSDLFEAARERIGLRTIYALADPEPEAAPDHVGFIDRALIEREVPDFHERIFYVSGPHAMVRQFQRVLAELGVARSRIRTDHFPGFA